MPESSFKYSISSLIDSVGFIDYEEPVSIFLTMFC